jgi:LysR family nitrogen assimilation transcriptional regulator
LTEAGKELLERGIPLLEQLRRLRTDIVVMGGEPTGTVVLGVPPTVSLVLVTSLITHFRRNFPKVTLDVIEGFSGHINEWLANGRLDVAVLYDAPKTRNLVADRILVEDLFLVCPSNTPIGSDKPISFSELEGVPLILPRRPHGLRLLIESVATKQNVDIRIDYEMDALPVIKNMVEDGNAYTILPSAPVYHEVATGRLVLRKFDSPSITRTLVLATSTQKPLSLAARSLITQIKKEVTNLVASGKWSGATKSV